MQIMRFPQSLKQYPSEGRWLPTTLHHSEFVQRYSGQIYPSEKHEWDLYLNVPGPWGPWKSVSTLASSNRHCLWLVVLTLICPSLNSECPGPCETRQGREVRTSADNTLLGSEAQGSMPWRTEPGVPPMPWRTERGVPCAYRSLQPSSSLSFGMKAWICRAVQQKLSLILTIVGLVLCYQCFGFGFFFFFASDIQTMMESWQNVLCVIKGVVWSLF